MAIFCEYPAILGCVETGCTCKLCTFNGKRENKRTHPKVLMVWRNVLSYPHDCLLLSVLHQSTFTSCQRRVCLFDLAQALVGICPRIETCNQLPSVAGPTQIKPKFPDKLHLIPLNFCHVNELFQWYRDHANAYCSVKNYTLCSTR